jgi:hypothetical protein
MSAVLESEDHLPLDNKTLPHRAAECWISLIHASEVCRDNEQPMHPLWLIVELLWRVNRPGDTSSNAARCEKMWKTIFYVCTLSQFNVYGTSTAAPRLAAAWPLAEIAMRQVRIGVGLDAPLSTHAILLRDRYVGLFPSRCFYLWKIWGWDLSISNAQPVFNQLTELFRSRKFINLAHEKVDFPEFIKQANFSLLSQYESSDSAYMLFLKLVVHVSQQEPPNSPRIRKLVSLAIPVGSLLITGNKSDHEKELSMVYNRFAANFVGLYLEPDSFESRFAQVKTCVNFSTADELFRKAIIRAISAWSCFLIELRKPLGPTVQWIQEVADILLQESKETSALEEKTSMSLMALFAAVRNIFKTLQSTGQYPDPEFLEAVKKISSLSMVSDSYMGFILVQLLRAFFAARQSYLQPAPFVSTEGESQEEWREIDAAFDSVPVESPQHMAAVSNVSEKKFQK